jgi:hypothetical protein
MSSKNSCQEISSQEEIVAQYIELIEYLREAWGKRGFKQKTLAAQAGVNTTSLNKFINHGIIPSFDNMFRLPYAYLGRTPITFTPESPADIYKETIVKIAELLRKLPTQ